MSTPRAVISLEIPAIKSVRVETTYDVDEIDGPTALLVIRTDGESYFIGLDPTDLPLIQKAITEYVEENAQ